MNLNYIKANPSGNTTIFVTSPVPRHLYSSIASMIMKPEYLASEQVGYIEPSKKVQNGFHLEMMAGEFCGNASRCFAAWQVMNGILQTNNNIDKTISLNLDVSGTDSLLSAYVEITNDVHTYEVAVEMPLPKKVVLGKDQHLGEYGIVDFDGIVHVVLQDVTPASQYIERASRLLNDSGLSDSAVGLMFLNMKSRPISMTPLVYIRSLESLVWENSCGSGSSAVAAILAHKIHCDITRKIRQPGGDLTVSVRWDDNQIRKIYLSGQIHFSSEGTLYIPE